jgi:hypothetical protein
MHMLAMFISLDNRSDKSVARLKKTVTTQYISRWLHQMAGLSRFGLVGCLTELASFIKGLPGKKTHVHCLYCATP